MRRSRATRRSSSRRRISACANGSRARSASAGPRQRPRASREEPGCSLRWCVLRVGEEPLEAQEVELVRFQPDQVAGLSSLDQASGASAFRSWETWYWSAFEAARGGCAPQSSSISRSEDTTSLAEVSSNTSSARSLDPLSVSGRSAVDDLERA